MGQTEGNFFNGAEILIAEDSQTQAEQLTHYLSARGYTVTVARDGKQALAAALRSTPAMIITDVVMPEMDGYTSCKEIKSLPALKDVPVVLLTSLPGPRTLSKVWNAVRIVLSDNPTTTNTCFRESNTS